MNRQLLKTITTVLTATLGGIATAQTTPVRFTLDFAFQGPQGPFLLAQERGYYDQAGLNVRIDRGFGSADAISKIASGAYDMGFGDFNAMLEFNARNPQNRLIAIYMVHDAPAFSVLTLNPDIRVPKDLEGKTLAAPAGDSGRRLFPLFAEANGIDESKVKFITVDATLREATLARGQADAITGFSFTSLLNLKNVGVAENRIRIMPYSASVRGLYGNAVIARPDFLKKNPAAARAFLAATVRGFQDTLKDPRAAVAAVKKRDALVNETLELERLNLALKNNIVTADARAFGLGQVRRDRLAQSIKLVTRAFELPAGLTPQNVFTDAYLPPLASRRVK